MLMFRHPASAGPTTLLMHSNARPETVAPKRAFHIKPSPTPRVVAMATCLRKPNFLEYPVHNSLAQ